MKTKEQQLAAAKRNYQCGLLTKEQYDEKVKQIEAGN